MRCERELAADNAVDAALTQAREAQERWRLAPVAERARICLAFCERFEAAGLRFIVNPYQGEFEGRQFPRDYDAAERRLVEGASATLDPALAEDREQVVIAGHILRMHDESPKGRLCRSGHMYARVMHDGTVYRCQPYECRGWEKLGSLFDPDLRLRVAPTPCHSERCEFEYKYLVDAEAVR